MSRKLKEITEFRMALPHGGWHLYDSFKFMHARPAKNDRRRMVCVGREAFTCREFFIRALRYFITEKTNSYNYFKEIDTSRVYITVSGDRCGSMDARDTMMPEFRSRLEKSLAIVNALESKYKWPRTKIYPVIPTGRNIRPAMLFIGDRRWNKSPYLMSLYTLIIRAGWRTWVPESVKGKAWEEVKRIISKAANKKISNNEDVGWVRNSVNYWHLLLEKYDHLFGEEDRAYQWSEERLGSSYNSTSEGIDRLVSGSTDHSELYKKFKVLMQEVLQNESKAAAGKS